MLFNSYFFILIFLPVTLMGYLKLESMGKYRTRMIWILLASLFFYGWWNPVYLILLFVSIGTNYFLGSFLSFRSDTGNRYKLFVLNIGVGFNLCLICYFKYFNFFIDIFNGAFQTDFHLKKIVLPLAISFYTFQQIAFLVDAYRGETKEYSFLQYAVFVSFFPQLIAGPIVHHNEILPQLFDRKRKWDLDLSIGITIFCIGLFKKIIIADNFALIANPVFHVAEQGYSLNFFMACKGVFSYTLQLYFDFSGYSDMAIGLGRMFGIQLPLNFHSPYRADNIIEFWRRWHITLSRFLKAYLYFPLGGNRKGIVRKYVNLMVTMLLGGLWHGAGWTFVVWGGIHGLMLVVNHIFRSIRKQPLQSILSKNISRLFTFLCVAFAWVFFRAETFQGAINVFKGVLNLPYTLQGRIGSLENLLLAIGFHFNGPFITLSDYLSLFWFVIWILILWFWPNTQQWLSNYDPALNIEQYSSQIDTIYFNKLKWQPLKVWGVAMALVGLICFLNLSKPTEFLYFQF